MCESTGSVSHLELVNDLMTLLAGPPREPEDPGGKKEQGGGIRHQILLMADTSNPEVEKVVDQVHEAVQMYQDKIQIVVLEDAKEFKSYMDELSQSPEVYNVFMTGLLVHDTRSLEGAKTVLRDYEDRQSIVESTSGNDPELWRTMFKMSLPASVPGYELPDTLNISELKSEKNEVQTGTSEDLLEIVDRIVECAEEIGKRNEE